MTSRLILAFLLMGSAANAADLGSVSFPTSTTNADAQAAFERGVAALHSFWYEEAATAFRRAQQLDPTFAMAFWGEAMTFNHPIWYEQDRDAARAVLVKAPKSGSERERDWIATLNVLYGDGEKPARDAAYEKAMASLAARDINAVEAEAFHALAILGTMDHGPGDARKQIRAAAILEPLMATHPSHPGVLHYLIHAYDDPLHAPLGLRAATRYARVAPAAHHALHMPSHIFLQLGMWNEAAASNEQSWSASVAWVAREKLPSSKRDLHSLAWLQYIYLQQGRRDDAKRLLDLVSNTSDRERATRARMIARWAIETGEIVDAGDGGGDEGAHCATPMTSSGEVVQFTRALNAIKRGNDPSDAIAAVAAAAVKEKRPNEKHTMETMTLVLRALDAQHRGDLTKALDFAKRAADVEETLGPPSGPPDVMKPAHELYGELLLAAGKPRDALAQFASSLQRMPNRALSLAGEANARATIARQ
ncbi:MAG TPA: hypothetical protein VN181_04040 [Thermoanaerobaculia bacterium]|nr:hypothetical protein [Thermoanaerobaculia bacterium]